MTLDFNDDGRAGAPKPHDVVRPTIAYAWLDFNVQSRNLPKDPQRVSLELAASSIRSNSLFHSLCEYIRFCEIAKV